MNKEVFTSFVKASRDINFEIKISFNQREKKFFYEILLNGAVNYKGTSLGYDFDDCIVTILDRIEYHFVVAKTEKQRFITEFTTELGSLFKQTSCFQSRIDWIHKFVDPVENVAYGYRRATLLMVFVRECEMLSMYDKVESKYSDALKVLREEF